MFSSALFAFLIKYSLFSPAPILSAERNVGITNLSVVITLWRSHFNPYYRRMLTGRRKGAERHGERTCRRTRFSHLRYVTNASNTAPHTHDVVISQYPQSRHEIFSSTSGIQGHVQDENQRRRPNRLSILAPNNTIR